MKIRPSIHHNFWPDGGGVRLAFYQPGEIYEYYWRVENKVFKMNSARNYHQVQSFNLTADAKKINES